MWKLAGKEGVIKVHKQMLLALSIQCIPQIDRVLLVRFRNGTGIYTMLNLIKKAGEGTYYPKGFDKEEDLQVLLFLCLGGQTLLTMSLEPPQSPPSTAEPQ